MVLRFNGQKVDRDQADAVSYLVTKDLVWYDPRLDITQEVVSRLKQRSQYGRSNMSSAHGRPGIPAQPRR